MDTLRYYGQFVENGERSTYNNTDSVSSNSTTYHGIAKKKQA